MPEPEPGRHHINELDRLRRQMREKDLFDMCKKLELLKQNAKTSQEIVYALEDVREGLEYLEFDVCLLFIKFIEYYHLNQTNFSLRIVYQTLLYGYFAMENGSLIIDCQPMMSFIPLMLIVAVDYVEKFKQLH